MIQVQNLSKRYLDRTIFHRINFKVSKGECVGLSGPNGSGKTTLLKILAGLIRPTEGKIEYEGKLERPPSQIGFLTHSTYLYDNLTALENLLFYARLYSVPNGNERSLDLLETFGLQERARDPVRTFSRGMKQRLSLARVFLHRPTMLFLDEPYASLDPEGCRQLNELLWEYKEGGNTLLLTTHQMSEAESVVDRWLSLVQQ